MDAYVALYSVGLFVHNDLSTQTFGMIIFMHVLIGFVDVQWYKTPLNNVDILFVSKQLYTIMFLSFKKIKGLSCA